MSMWLKQVSSVERRSLSRRVPYRRFHCIIEYDRVSCCIYLLSALVKESKGCALRVNETPLFDEDAEELCVEEMAEERPLGNGDVLQKLLLVEEKRCISRSL